MNCDNAEELGVSTHEKLDGTNLATAKIKHKDCVKSLESLSSFANVAEEHVYINPSILFIRLAAVTQYEDDIERCFMHETSPYHLSPFKDWSKETSQRW